MEKRYYFVFSDGAVLVIDREQNASIAECQNSYQAGKIVDALNLAEQMEMGGAAIADAMNKE